MHLSKDGKKRWLVQGVDPLTVESIKALASAKRQTIGVTLDQAVAYFTRKISFDENKPLRWFLPDDF